MYRLVVDAVSDAGPTSETRAHCREIETLKAQLVSCKADCESLQQEVSQRISKGGREWRSMASTTVRVPMLGGGCAVQEGAHAGCGMLQEEWKTKCIAAQSENKRLLQQHAKLVEERDRCRGELVTKGKEVETLTSRIKLIQARFAEQQVWLGIGHRGCAVSSLWVNCFAPHPVVIRTRPKPKSSKPLLRLKTRPQSRRLSLNRVPSRHHLPPALHLCSCCFVWMRKSRSQHLPDLKS